MLRPIRCKHLQRKQLKTSDNIFGFAVISCLIIVRRVHIWMECTIPNIDNYHMTAKPKLPSFILFQFSNAVWNQIGSPPFVSWHFFQPSSIMLTNNSQSVHSTTRRGTQDVCCLHIRVILHVVLNNCDFNVITCYHIIGTTLCEPATPTIYTLMHNEVVSSTAWQLSTESWKNQSK